MEETVSVERRVLDWLANGEPGLSSKTMAQVFSGAPVAGRYFGDVPIDPDDFKRCLLLLRRFPEWRERLGEMATVGRWARLVAAWDVIERTFMEETGGNFSRFSAPYTWVAIECAIRSAEEATRLAARNHYDLLRATLVVDAVEAACARLSLPAPAAEAAKLR